jgi:hypothetical protein
LTAWRASYSIVPLISGDTIGEKATCVFDSKLTEADGQPLPYEGRLLNEGSPKSREDKRPA